MRAVVSGATGYLGSRLVEMLVECGHDVLAIVQRTCSADQLLERVPTVDVAESSGSAEVLAEDLRAFRPNVAIHLAACQDQSDSAAAVAPLIDANIGFATRFAWACADSGVRAFVNTGSFSAHGSGSEEYRPASLYAATKVAFVVMLEYYRQTTDMRCVTLELTDTYGPSDSRPKFLNLVEQAALAGTTLDATPGEQVVSLVHVDDIARAFIHAAETQLCAALPDAVYSVAADEPLTLRELVGVWSAATGRTANVRWGGREYRSHEIMRPYLHERLPGWRPVISLDEGLRQVYGADTDMVSSPNDRQ